MSRIHIKKSVIAYLDKSLSINKQQEIDSHLLTCDTCRRYVNRMASVYFSCDNRILPEVNPFFLTRVLAKLEKEQHTGVELPVSVLKSLRPVAAGLFMLTAITFSIFFSNYVISTNRLNSNSQINSTSEASYEYYLGTSGDPMVNLIISIEN